MVNFRNTFFLMLVVTIFQGFLFAQSPTMPKINTSFISTEGGFSIDLPKEVSDSRVINPYPGVKSGNQYNWKIPQGRFLIAYLDKTILAKTARQTLQNEATNLIQNTAHYGGKLITQKEIALNKYPGIEVKLLISAGAVSVTRYYLVKNRLYSLTTGWLGKEDGATQLKILDSFQLITLKTKIN